MPPLKQLNHGLFQEVGAAPDFLYNSKVYAIVEVLLKKITQLIETNLPPQFKLKCEYLFRRRKAVTTNCKFERTTINITEFIEII